MFSRPHYVRDYRRMVRNRLSRHDRATAMEMAVGGAYLEMGRREAQLLDARGLAPHSYLIDVGCGSGRLAFALRDRPSLRYLGTDVVPELLEHAEQRVDRQDWDFRLVEGLTIPEADAQSDFVALFSVLTHLSEAESIAYLNDAARVLKPTGKIIASFLDPGLSHHRIMAGGSLRQIYGRLRGRTVRNTMLHPDTLAKAAAAMNMRAEFFGPEMLGQSYVVISH